MISDWGLLENNIALGNSLVDMYGKCCSLEEARRVFKDTNKKNDVSWSVIVSAHIYNQCINEAFRLFYEIEPSDHCKRMNMVSKM